MYKREMQQNLHNCSVISQTIIYFTAFGRDVYSLIVVLSFHKWRVYRAQSHATLRRWHTGEWCAISMTWRRICTRVAHTYTVYLDIWHSGHSGQCPRGRHRSLHSSAINFYWQWREWKIIIGVGMPDTKG